MANIPESEILDVREYLYVDSGRVRSLLAQLYKGVPEEEENLYQRSRKLTASISKVFGVGGEIGGVFQEQEKRSLNDLHVTMLEEYAEAMGVLMDVSEVAAMPKNWKRGKLHSKLSEGALIRLESDVRVIDAANFTKAMLAFSEAAEDESQFAEQVRKMTTALYGDHIAIRCYPCGVEESSCCFGGIVPGDSEYFKSERSALFSRMGPDAQRWTALLQVARIPARGRQGARRSMADFQERFDDFQTSDGNFNRHTLDSFILEIMRELEEVGLQESQRFPEISVVPLAIYRFVPQGRELSDLLLED
mgnify:CR=1 FL=1